jgi:hypothetical protein
LSAEDQKAWDDTVAAAKKEGEVLWSNTQAIDWMDRASAQFTRKYGIKVNEEVSPPTSTPATPPNSPPASSRPTFAPVAAQPCATSTPAR